MQSYTGKDIIEYQKLFTGDFQFEFSSAADPGLVQRYASGWTRNDETIASQNLFQGGTNSDGVFVPQAIRIDVAMTPTAPVDDNSGGRDPNIYKVLLASVDLRIDVIGDLTYVVGQAPPQTHRFFFVRGDSAKGLSPEQPADSLHWYIWKWRDESPPLKATRGPVAAESATWGRIKGLYR